MSNLLRLVIAPPRAARAGAGIALLGLLVLFGSTANPYYANIVILTFFAVVLAVSYRLLLHTREASFCHGTFYMVGAYATALLTTKAGWDFWWTVPVAGVVAVVSAVIIGMPSLRTSGPYFFLITFGFLVVVGSVAANAGWLTGGFSGINGIPAPAGIGSIRGFYFAALALAVICVVVFVLFDRSRWGLELVALGDARDLAQATGTARYANMLMAFAVGALFAGITGSLYASYITFVSPNSFTLWTSIYVLMYVVVGGSRYLSGAVLGAALLTLPPIALNWSANWQAVFAAAITLVIIVLAPRGVLVELADRGRAFVTGKAAGGQAAGGQAAGGRAAGGQAGAPPVSLTTRDLPPAPPGRTDLLVVRDLSIRFGGVRAVNNVSLTVREQECVGVIGPNGAGKTTLFNCISGFATPDSGSVELSGRPITGMAAHRIARSGLVRTFQASVVFERLTVFENLLVGCRTQADGPLARAFVPVRARQGDASRARDLLEAFDLTRWADAPAGSVPYGIRKILGVAICVAAQPKLLCLDEPMAGLHGSEVAKMQAVLSGLASDHGVSLLIIEHRIPVVMSICHRLVVLNFGEVIAAGTPAEVRQNPQVIEAYLGEAGRATNPA